MVRFRGKAGVLVTKLAEQGLHVFGSFSVGRSECPPQMQHCANQYGVLVGNAGAQMWTEFANSPEFQDGKKDPLDRWTMRVIDGLASEVGAEAIFPFGKPCWPFQRFARKITGIFQSPLGLLIHQEYGLWFAFRAILLFCPEGKIAGDFKHASQERDLAISPCERCYDKPCLSACPVSAFDGHNFDQHGCREFLSSECGEMCMSSGCGARNACPVARNYHYCTNQLRFHMHSFTLQ